MASVTVTRPAGAPVQPSVHPCPPLESGDRLTREEFERRYDAMPKHVKAELVKGVVYVSSPVSCAYHGSPHFDFITWLGLYRALTRGVQGADNASIRLDDENEPQPDALLGILAVHGGRMILDEHGYLIGTPDLVAEVAASSASYDLHDKLEVYRRHGMQEYIVWRVLDLAIDWFVLREDHYEKLPVTPEGWYKSEVFPGLWLDPGAMIRGDMATVLKVAQQRIASAEHAAFVARLAQAAKPSEPHS